MFFLTYFLENNNEKKDNNMLLLLMISINKIKTLNNNDLKSYEDGHYHSIVEIRDTYLIQIF